MISPNGNINIGGIVQLNLVPLNKAINIREKDMKCVLFIEQNFTPITVYRTYKSDKIQTNIGKSDAGITYPSEIRWLIPQERIELWESIIPYVNQYVILIATLNRGAKKIYGTLDFPLYLTANSLPKTTPDSFDGVEIICVGSDLKPGRFLKDILEYIPPSSPTILVPTLSTADISDIDFTTASCGGAIISNGGAIITSCGVCWSTSHNPTINDSKTIDGVSNNFTSSLSNLIKNTTYYIRSYAENSAGIGYGDEKSFSTIDDILIFNEIFDSWLGDAPYDQYPIGWTIGRYGGPHSNAWCEPNTNGLKFIHTVSITEARLCKVLDSAMSGSIRLTVDVYTEEYIGNLGENPIVIHGFNSSDVEIFSDKIIQSPAETKTFEFDVSDLKELKFYYGISEVDSYSSVVISSIKLELIG